MQMISVGSSQIVCDSFLCLDTEYNFWVDLKSDCDCYHMSNPKRIVNNNFIHNYRLYVVEFILQLYFTYISEFILWNDVAISFVA